MPEPGCCFNPADTNCVRFIGSDNIPAGDVRTELWALITPDVTTRFEVTDVVETEVEAVVADGSADTMVTKVVGALPMVAVLDCFCGLFSPKAPDDEAVVEETAATPGRELTNILPDGFCNTPVLLMTLIGTGTAIPPPGTDTAVSDTCMFCKPCMLAILTPGNPVMFCMLMFGGSPVKLAMFILATPGCCVMLVVPVELSLPEL